MLPLRIEGAHIIMRGPVSGDGIEIRDLAIRVIDGCSISRWELTPAELEMLIAGGSIELWVQGLQPPVSLKVVPHVEE